MKYYKGNTDVDVPENGGAFVRENGYGMELYNFLPRRARDKQYYCYGYVETKTTQYGHNTMHIERIDQAISKTDQFAEGVLVVWCALSNDYGMTVVGWYHNARVYRNSKVKNFKPKQEQYYFAVSRKEDCTLLPISQRRMQRWKMPHAASDEIGMGQAMVWYANQPSASTFRNKIARYIRQYAGENWIDRDIDMEAQESDAGAGELDGQAEEYIEGAKIEATMFCQKRNAALVSAAKDCAFKRDGKLQCEVCGFDYSATYGELGLGYIEAHHKKPVSDLQPNSVLKVGDIALVCGNCHRMIHRRKPCLTVSELQMLIGKNIKGKR